MAEWTDRLDSLRALFGDRLGVGGDLRSQVRRARRRLSRRARREAQVLIQAEEMARHPRFARLVDPREVARAERRLSRRLRAIDPARDRRARRLDALARAAFYALAVFALVVTLLWWRGLV